MERGTEISGEGINFKHLCQQVSDASNPSDVLPMLDEQVEE